MHFDILTLFPEMIQPILNESILKRAQNENVFSYNLLNFRKYSDDKHQKVDDYPYGGGAGMVLKAQPIFDCVDSAKRARDSKPRVILLCPQGEKYSQTKAEEFAKEEHLILICGHYEGYDERIRENLVTDEISIGDFILTGGELGALTILDSVVRLLPQALGNQSSSQDDSFSTGLLEYPQYTRPSDFRGLKVPEILLSGHHENIRLWRKKESLKRTWLRRKDLLDNIRLNDEENSLLEELKNELENE